jgi:hypothetical protein
MLGSSGNSVDTVFHVVDLDFKEGKTSTSNPSTKSLCPLTKTDDERLNKSSTVNGTDNGKRQADAHE